MSTCACVGDWCTCGGTRHLKTDKAVNLPLMMKDSAMTEKPTMDTMPSATMTLDDALKLPRYHGMSPGNARQYATRDIARAQMGSQGSLEYQAGIRDHYSERLANAWKGPQAVNDNNRVDPQFAKDGRAFADLSDSEKARQRAIRDQSEAWKA